MQNTTAQLAILQQFFSNLAPSQKADFVAWLNTPVAPKAESVKQEADCP